MEDYDVMDDICDALDATYNKDYIRLDVKTILMKEATFNRYKSIISNVSLDLYDASLWELSKVY